MSRSKEDKELVLKDANKLFGTGVFRKICKQAWDNFKLSFLEKGNNFFRYYKSHEELQKTEQPRSELNSLSFYEARKQMDCFFKNKELYRSPLNEKETKPKLIDERNAFESPIAKLNFRMKLTHLFVNPALSIDISTKYKFPSLLDLCLFKIRTMKIDGQLNEELVNRTPKDLLEKVQKKAAMRAFMS